MSEDSESMIDRVAKAITSSREIPTLLPWEQIAARAAIEAMREPTPEMVELGFVVERASENNPATYDDPISLVAYKAMISAALSENEAPVERDADRG